MKKFTLLLLTFLALNSSIGVMAAPPPPPPHNGHCHHNDYYYDSPYIIYQTITSTEVPVYNCNKHFIEVQTVVTDYSNNTKTEFKEYTAYDNYGNIIVNNCIAMEHIVYNNKCYFIIKYYKSGYKTLILCENSNFKITNEYSYFKEIDKNKYLVTKNGLDGIIDIDENEIVPIKYDSLVKMNHNTYKTHMNGAYGVISTDGKIILNCEYNKIKKLGNTYYQAKKGNKWGILTDSGKIIAPVKYKDVKISKNVLYVKDFGGKWVKLNNYNNY